MGTGLLPHEILLSMARGDVQVEQYVDKESGEVLTRLVAVDLEARRDAAKAAAPYYAPKMATVELVKTVSDDELDAIIAELAAEAGFGNSAEGTGGTSCEESSTDEDDDHTVVKRGRRSALD